MGCFKPWMDILPEAQRQLWGQLQPTQAFGLVLYEMKKRP